MAYAIKLRITLILSCLSFALIPILIHLPSIAGEGASRIAITAAVVVLTIPILLITAAGSAKASKEVSKTLGDLLSADGSISKTIYLFIALYAISDARAGFDLLTQPLSYIGFTLIAIALYAAGYISTQLNSDADGEAALMQCITLGSTGYIVLNLIGHAIGIRLSTLQEAIDGAGQNGMLATVGITYNRVAFPFATGLNNFAIFSGISTVFAINGITSSSSLIAKTLNIIAALIGLVGLILVDSRGAIVMIIASLTLQKQLKKQKIAKYSFPTIAIVGSILPFIIIPAAHYINNSNIAQLLQRGGDFANKLGVASGREYIWAEIIKAITHSPYTILFGYGTYGQISSGAASNFAWIFPGQTSDAARTAHNSSLQFTLDMGLAGLFIWFAFWVNVGNGLASSIDHIHRKISPLIKSTTSCLLLLLLTGWTEATCTMYSLETLMFLIFFSGILQGYLAKNATKQIANTP